MLYECHKAFEEWAKQNGLDLSPSPKGPNRYQWNTTRNAWNGWKAAWDTKRESVDPDLLTIVRMIAADSGARFQQEAKDLLSKIEGGES